jgi:hypothetical protein
VTLVEGKYVYVRGVSDRYSNTTLNGAALTSTEPEKKSFAFDMFPSELLENANVLKSFTPDLPGNFAGGLVQLNTIDFPSGRSFKVSGSQGFNDYVTFKNNGMLDVAGGSGDWLGMDDGGRSTPSDLPVDRLGMNQLLRDVRSGDPDAIARMDNIGRSFNNGNWKTGQATATPNGSMSMTYTDVLSIGEDDQIGVVASANYGASFQNNSMVRGGVLANPNDYLFSRPVALAGVVLPILPIALASQRRSHSRTPSTAPPTLITSTCQAKTSRRASNNVCSASSTSRSSSTQVRLPVNTTSEPGTTCLWTGVSVTPIPADTSRISDVCSFCATRQTAVCRCSQPST